MSFGTKPITLFRAIAFALVLLCLATLLMPFLSFSMRELGMKINVGIGIFSTSLDGEYTSFWSVMLIINGILLILLAALAIFGLIKDLKLLVLPLSLIGFITFFLTVFQKAFIEESMLGLGRGPWLLLILSLLASGAALLDHLAAGKPIKEFFDLGALGIKLPERKVPQRNAAPGWVCPQCGAPQAASVRFCGSCGAQKPEPRLCPNCGKACQPGVAFCDNCGSRL